MVAKKNGWNSYEKLVLSELADLKLAIGLITDALAKITTRVSVVEVKAGIWGALAGAAMAAPIAYELVRHVR